MIRIGYHDYLDDDDKAAIESLVKDLDSVTFDEHRVPGITGIPSGGGGIHIDNLGLIVFVFLGYGAKVFFKAFLEKLGSGLGEEVVNRLRERFKRVPKKEEYHLQINEPAVAIVEVRPEVFLIVNLSLMDEEKFSRLKQTPQMIENDIKGLDLNKKGYSYLLYDEKTDSWTAEKLQNPTKFLYYDKDGEERSIMQ